MAISGTLNMLAEEVHLLVVAIQVNCAAEHLCCVAIKNHFSFGEQIISFERAKTNHDKTTV